MVAEEQSVYSQLGLRKANSKCEENPEVAEPEDQVLRRYWTS